MSVAAFRDYLKQNAPEVRSFTADELFVKGSNAKGLNTDPPRDLWPNGIQLAKLLQAFRDRVGVAVVLTSVYRSPAYNRDIGGATSSLHMQFKAADLRVVGRGTPADWAATLREMRAAGVFKGGIGTYDTFVHVDVRGTNVDFDYRTGAKPAGRPLGPATPRQPDEPPRVTPPPATGNATPEIGAGTALVVGPAVALGTGDWWPLVVAGAIAFAFIAYRIAKKRRG